MINYNFVIKYILEKNNIEVDALNRRSDYEVYFKLFKLLLRKEGQDLRIIEAIKENEDIIRECHDSKLARHLKIYKTLKRVQ